MSGDHPWYGRRTRCLVLGIAGLAGLVAMRSRVSRAGDEQEAVLIQGRVVDAGGSGVAGAQVFLDRWFAPLWAGPTARSPREASRATASSPDGDYSFPADSGLREVLERDRVRLWAVHGDRVSAPRLVRWRRPTTSVPDLLLGPGVLHEVLVRWRDDDSPAVGARVSLYRKEPAPSDSDPHESSRFLEGVADAEARLVFGPLPDRPFELSGRAWHAESAVHLFWDVTSVRRGDGRLSSALVLERGLVVRGRVLGADGTPIVGACVAPWEEESGDPDAERVVRTDAQGRFEVHGVKAGGSFRVHGPGDPDDPLAALGTHGPPLSIRRVEGEPGATVDVGELRLPTLRVLRFRILYAEGNPARKGWVLLERADARHGAMGHSIDEGGRATVDDVPVGVRLRAQVTIDHPVHGDLEGRFEIGTDAEGEITLRVTGAGMLIVRFHPVGRPAESLIVESPALLWGPDGSMGGGPSGRHADVRHLFEPGLRRDIQVRAEGYEQRRLGRVEISAAGPTYVDVELAPR